MAPHADQEIIWYWTENEVRLNHNRWRHAATLRTNGADQEADRQRAGKTTRRNLPR